MNLLTVSGICKQKGNDPVLNNIRFVQAAGQKIGIAGETGSGKTTLLKIIAGLIEPDQGNVLYKNKKVIGPFDKLVPGHPEIAYLSQQFELPQHLRVEQVLEYANTLPPQTTTDLFEICQIDHLLKRKTHQLSGGEKQRIAIARLLISSPGLLLLDEPFSNLDMIHTDTLKKVIGNIGSKLKISCIMISHTPADILSWADEIIVMKKGNIVQKGDPRNVYRQPVNEYVAGLFGDYFFAATDQLSIVSPGIAKDLSCRVFLRPEYFAMTGASAQSISGVITESIFFGPYYDLGVRTAFGLFTIRTLEEPPRPGEIIHLTLRNHNPWCM